MAGERKTCKSSVLSKLDLGVGAQVYFAESFLNSGEQDEMLRFVRSLKHGNKMTEAHPTSIHQKQHYWKTFFGDKGP